MTWGAHGSWGGSPWGTGSVLPPPSLIAVVSEPDVAAETTEPAVIAEQGGTVCFVLGTNFADPMTVELLTGGPGTYVVVAEGYIVNARYDIDSSRCYFGAPSLERGLYHLRVTTEGGESNVLEDVIAARWFAEEYKTLSVRSKFSASWDTGPRILRGG